MNINKILFQQFESNWEKPGDIEIHSQKRFISSHPGDDRDSDSDDEDSKQLPTPIQEEPIREHEDHQSVETTQEHSVENVEENEPMEEEVETSDNNSKDNMVDTGEAENDE